MVMPAKLAMFTNRFARIYPSGNWIHKSSRDPRYDRGTGSFRLKCFLDDGELLDPFKTPEPLPILNPSNFVPKNGFPVAKGFNQSAGISLFFFQSVFFRCIYLGHGDVRREALLFLSETAYGRRIEPFKR